MNTTKYVKAHVRTEGDVNHEWELFCADGTSDRFYSIDSETPRWCEDDEKVSVEELCKLLYTLREVPCPINEAKEYDVCLLTYTVSNVRTFNEQDMEI